jgi:hypothetical protein
VLDVPAAIRDQVDVEAAAIVTHLPGPHVLVYQGKRYALIAEDEVQHAVDKGTIPGYVLLSQEVVSVLRCGVDILTWPEES